MVASYYDLIGYISSEMGTRVLQVLRVKEVKYSHGWEILVIEVECYRCYMWIQDYMFIQFLYQALKVGKTSHFAKKCPNNIEQNLRIHKKASNNVVTFHTTHTKKH